MSTTSAPDEPGPGKKGKEHPQSPGESDSRDSYGSLTDEELKKTRKKEAAVRGRVSRAIGNLKRRNSYTALDESEQQKRVAEVEASAKV